jgi:arsenite/tail-anchored protein-transporting ATPase
LRPRTILYTGKGGVGKTSVAAATARRCAAAGRRTIVLSTDPAHSLADSLEEHVGSEPTQIADHLWAQQVQAQDELERNWSAVQGWLAGLFVDQGVDRIAAEELTVPPGGDELFSLLQLKRHVEDGGWDVVIVDCAPTGETLRLLSFPDVAQWWLDKVFGRERALLAAARPLARTFFDVTLPDEKVFGEVQRLVENLIAMNEILRDRAAVSIRLVMTPDRMVIAEAMRTFTYLSLYGYLTDAVVVNRVFPEEVEGGYFGAWRAVQREQLELVESGFAPVPVLRAPYFEQEVLGATMLDRLGASLFDGADAGGILHDKLAQELSLDGDGARLRLDIPFTDKGDISLKKIGLELIVRVDGHKRTILLPPALAPYRPSSASFSEGSLLVSFSG